MRKFDYHQPGTLKDAYRLMEKAKGKAKYIAGGTDLIVHMKNRAVQPDTLVSLKRIGELSGIRHNGDLVMGSMTLLRDIERNPFVAHQYPALAQAVSSLGTPQIRNVATLGGNLCNAAPSADCAPPLLVLEAIFTVEGPGGLREVAVEDFFTSPGETCMDMAEVLTRIRVPAPRDNEKMAFLKIGRSSTDIAIVNAAVCLAMERNTCRKCCLAVGAVAPVPLRLTSVEKMIEGEEITDELLRKAQEMTEQAVKPITDVRSSEEYRRIMSGVLIRRAIRHALKGMEAHS